MKLIFDINDIDDDIYGPGDAVPPPPQTPAQLKHIPNIGDEFDTSVDNIEKGLDELLGPEKTEDTTYDDIAFLKNELADQQKGIDETAAKQKKIDDFWKDSPEDLIEPKKAGRRKKTPEQRMRAIKAYDIQVANAKRRESLEADARQKIVDDTPKKLIKNLTKPDLVPIKTAMPAMPVLKSPNPKEIPKGPVVSQTPYRVPKYDTNTSLSDEDMEMIQAHAASYDVFKYVSDIESLEVGTVGPVQFSQLLNRHTQLSAVTEFLLNKTESEPLTQEILDTYPNLKFMVENKEVLRRHIALIKAWWKVENELTQSIYWQEIKRNLKNLKK